MKRDSYIIHGDDGDITIETDGDGVVSVRGIDVDSELALAELGFEPHPCLIALDECINEAASKGAVDTVILLLAAGANVNASDWSCRTPLHRAAECGCADTIGVLVRAGANMNDVIIYNTSALHLAAAGGSTDAVEKLLALGANVEAKDCFGQTPLHHANLNKHREAADAIEAWIEEHS